MLKSPYSLLKVEQSIVAFERAEQNLVASSLLTMNHDIHKCTTFAEYNCSQVLQILYEAIKYCTGLL